MRGCVAIPGGEETLKLIEELFSGPREGAPTHEGREAKPSFPMAMAKKIFDRGAEAMPNNLCRDRPGDCARHLPSAKRLRMPQLATAQMLRYADRCRLPTRVVAWLVRFVPTEAQQSILREIPQRRPANANMKTGAVAPPTPNASRDERIDVRRGVTEGCNLTVTQAEASRSIVRSLVLRHRGTPVEEMTRADPIVVCRDLHIIDGHHRFHAARTLSRLRREPSCPVHVVRLDLDQHDSLCVGWILSKGAHGMA